MKLLSILFISVVLFSCSYNKIELPEPINNVPNDTTGTTTVTYSNSIKQIMDSHCTSCHSPSGSQSWLDVSTYSNTKAQATNGGLQNRVINETPSVMPPSGSIPQSDKDLLQQWINNGSPE